MSKIDLSKPDEKEVVTMSFTDLNAMKKKDLEELLLEGKTILLISNKCRPIKLILATIS